MALMLWLDGMMMMMMMMSVCGPTMPQLSAHTHLPPAASKKINCAGFYRPHCDTQGTPWPIHNTHITQVPTSRQAHFSSFLNH
jgi:hypothetical protein